LLSADGFAIQMVSQIGSHCILYPLGDRHFTLRLVYQITVDYHIDSVRSLSLI
jgi:hypothetical protein